MTKGLNWQNIWGSVLYLLQTGEAGRSNADHFCHVQDKTSHQEYGEVYKCTATNAHMTWDKVGGVYQATDKWV